MPAPLPSTHPQYNMPKPNLWFLCDLLWCLLQHKMKSVVMYVSHKSRRHSWPNLTLSTVHLVTTVVKALVISYVEGSSSC